MTHLPRPAATPPVAGGLARRAARVILPAALLAATAACTPNGTLDWDLRAPGQGSTAAAAQQATAARPDPDGRGVLSYPGYQVALARRGDTVASVAARVGAT